MSNDATQDKAWQTDGLGPLVERLLKYSDIRRNDPRESREALRELILGELADELQAVRKAQRDRCADAREIAELRDEADNLRWELDATKRAREATEAECARLRAEMAVERGLWTTHVDGLRERLRWAEEKHMALLATVANVVATQPRTVVLDLGPNVEFTGFGRAQEKR